MFESIIGHEKEKKTIENILKNNTFSHAYLFVGPSGIGKCLFAYELAKVLLNTKDIVKGKRALKGNKILSKAKLISVTLAK